MHNVRELIRPSNEEWASLPRRRSAVRPTLLAWLVGLLTVGGAFVADRGWEEAPLAWEESLLPINVFAFAATHTAILLGLVGGAAGRYLVFVLPPVLAMCAAAQFIVDARSTLVWAIGGVVALALAAEELGSSFRQRREIRKATARLRSGEMTEIGTKALAAERKVLSQGWWVTLALACISLALWTWFALDWVDARRKAIPPEGQAFEPMEAMFAIVFTLLAVLFLGRNMRRWFVHRYAGQFVWIVPGPGGPVWARSLAPLHGGLLDPQESEVPGCTCDDENERRDPEYEECPGEYVLLDDYCPAHGIDAVNAMDHEAFRSAASSSWPWDGGSRLPKPKDDLGASAPGLLSFAGHVFEGIPVKRHGSVMDTMEDQATSAYEMKRGEPDEPYWNGKLLPPADQGILDTIDLAPAGLSGTAVRYRHGRAWLRIDEQ